MTPVVTANELHRAALQHHTATAACPCRAIRSGTRLHLLIAASVPSLQLWRTHRETRNRYEMTTSLTAQELGKAVG
jgi:hypothetical protein